MLTRAEIDRKFAQKAPGAVTPAHSAAEAGQESDEAGTRDEDAKRRLRERVQHEADPYLHEAPEVDCLDVSELGKFRTEAVDVPAGYPPMRPIDAEQFRRGSATAGHAAYSPGYETPGRPVRIPSASLAPGQVSRPLLTDGRARPCAPGA
jgi:hypothetical protein